MVRILEILTECLTVPVCAIAVGVGIGAIVAIGNRGDSKLGCSPHGGQHSQQGSKKNELEHA